MLVTSTASPHRHRNASIRSSALALLVAAGLISVTGCAKTVTEKQTSLGASFSDQSTPLVISTQPKQDTAAFNHSERELHHADWETEKKLGPKPVWEKIPTPRGKILHEAQAKPTRVAAPADFATGQPVPGADATTDDGASAGATGASAGATMDAPPRAVRGESERRVATPFMAPPLADPAEGATPGQADPGPADPGHREPGRGDHDTQNYVSAPNDPLAAAEVRATSEPQVLEPRREMTEPPHAAEPLPVTVDKLFDDRVRLIWSLRHFGGPSVTSKVAGGTSRRDVTLKEANLAPLIDVLTQHLGTKGSAIALPSENSVVVVCPTDEQDEVIQLLDRLDRAQPQVEIAAKIFEVSHDFDYQQGARLLLNRLAEDGAQTALSSFNSASVLDALNNGTPLQGSVVSLMQTFQEAGVSIDASFQFLADAGMIEVVSSPRLTVAEGQTGYMLAGQELPIQSASFQNDVLKTTTEYKPVGVQLYITPQAVGDHDVKLHTVSIVSNVSGFAPVPDVFGHGKTQALLVNPIIESREAETAVTVEDGNTLVISGMRMVRTTTREEKVPGLGDIPLLGNLFKNQRSQQRMTDLYFFITPTLAHLDKE